MNRFKLFQELYPDASLSELYLWLPNLKFNDADSGSAFEVPEAIMFANKCNMGHDVDISTEDFKNRRDAYIKWQHEDFESRKHVWMDTYPGFQEPIPALGQAKVRSESEFSPNKIEARDSWREFDEDGNSIWGAYYNPYNHPHKVSPAS
jgi:hypothetical protein